ncbi:MAG: type II secretion system F family protein [Candidatus Altiarchaeota archaeon]|nr:type II secretion system F family protein [Candidatus Altiarchaeota archaeon]
MVSRSVKFFRRFTFILSNLNPNLEYNLKQADIEEDASIYLAATLIQAINMSLLLAVSVYYILWRAKSQYTIMGPVLGVIVAFFVIYQRLGKPKMIVKNRVKDIENHLVFTIQSLYIQISSGMPIYDAMASIARSNYGAASSEFMRAVDEIKSGTHVETALEDLASRNPSPYFQKTIWQIVNAIKTGGDLRYLLKDLTERLAQDQINTAKSFGAKLSPISMIYMLSAVIIPSLGTTVLITISSLPNIGGKISESTFWIILVVTIVLQLQFAMIIRSSRPSIIGD